MLNSLLVVSPFPVHEAGKKNGLLFRHTDAFYGKEAFTANRDLVVKLRDAKEFYRFLDLCYKKLVLKKSNASDR